METTELDALLAVFTDSRKAVITEAARAAGLLWQCRNPACQSDDNRTVEELCHGCGYDRQGRAISDHQPGVYPVPDELWEALREDLRAWVASSGTPRPDAMTFRYAPADGSTWSLRPVLHYGGRTQPCPASFEDSDVEEYLDEIANEGEPNYLEDLRITV